MMAAMGDAPGQLVSTIAEVPPLFVRNVLASQCFDRAPTLRTLLLYLWNHRNDSISEYAVATEALGRSENFNSKIDATVRVQISRLRQRLEKYYEEEGRSVAERIFIPLGSHRIEVQSATEVVVEPVAAPVNSTVRWLTIACSLLVLTSILLGIRAFRPIPLPVADRPVPARFWKAFFANQAPTRIIMPTPIFFSWANPSGRTQASLMFRDTEINRFDAGPASQGLRDLESRYGPSSLSQSYTVTSDTFASIRLVRYLDKLGFETNAMSSASAPLDALDRENVVALGTWGTLTPLQPYLDRMSFELQAHELNVRNRSPQPGEPANFESKKQSVERIVWPGIIALLPGRDRHTRLLILAGRHTSSLVSFLTSREGQDQLDGLWKAHGSPDFYDMVVESEMNSDTLVRFSAAALHPFKNAP